MPIVYKNLTEQAVREMQMIENLQKEDVQPLELGRAFKEYREKFGVTQQVLADKVGMRQEYISYLESLVVTTKPIQDYVESGELDGISARVPLAFGK